MTIILSFSNWINKDYNFLPIMYYSKVALKVNETIGAVKTLNL